MFPFLALRRVWPGASTSPSPGYPRCVRACVCVCARARACVRVRARVFVCMYKIVLIDTATHTNIKKNSQWQQCGTLAVASAHTVTVLTRHRSHRLEDDVRAET